MLLARRHQLQVVDHDQLQVGLLLQPARLGADLHHGQVRRVVDIQWRLADFAHPPRQPRPVVVAHPARTHVAELDLRLGRQQPHHDLGLAHLQREDDAGHPVLDRARPQKIQSQGRFAHSRSGRHDDHLPGMQTVGHLVEFGEAGRHAARMPPLEAMASISSIVGCSRSSSGTKSSDSPALGDVVDLGLRAVDHLGHVGALGARVAVLHHPRAGLHQPAQQRLLGHDARVVARVGGRRHRRDQGVQIRRTADPAQHPAAVQFGGHRHRVGGLAAPVEVQDRVVDVLVCGAVEVAGPQPFQHIGDGVLAQQHAAQHRLLGGQILRWLTAEVFTGRRASMPGARSSTTAMGSHLPLHTTRTYIR